MIAQTFAARIVLYITLAAFAVGVASGGLGVYKLWGYADTARQLRNLKAQLKAKDAAFVLNANKLREQNEIIDKLKLDVADALSKIPTDRQCFTPDDTDSVRSYWRR